jgi:amidohydrolase
MTDLRRKLHSQPELSGKESETAKLIVRELEKFSPSRILSGLGGTGVAAIFRGSDPGKTLLLRAELDGVPVAERSGAAHSSRNPGVAHACGHDGHMAILASVAELLSRTPPRMGRVVLLFQPAEETGEGGARVVRDGAFEEIRPDYSFALHNLPGLPLGEAAVRRGSIACASRGMTISLAGKRSHAAHPEEGLSPASALARLLAELPLLPSKIDCFSLVTLVGASLGALFADGSAPFGTSPGEAKVMATLRAETEAGIGSLAAAASSLAESLAAERGLGLEIGWQDIFPPCVNGAEGAAMVASACARAGVPCREKESAYRWSEDFGSILAASGEGALFTLGAGLSCPGLHNPDYDFPDSLIEPGRGIFRELIRCVNGLAD